MMRSKNSRTRVRGIPSTAAGAESVINMGAFSELDYLIALYVTWNNSVAISTEENVIVRYGFFTRPAMNTAQFDAGHFNLVPEGTIIRGSLFEATLPVCMTPPSECPFLCVAFANGAAAASMTGSIWTWLRPCDMNGYQEIPPPGTPSVPQVYQ